MTGMMNSASFPKPPPIDPLPLDVWLKRTDRAEAGREPFFRGREAEYGVYRSAVSSLGEGIVGSGTMIFQGAPGAGKSALMAECREAVRRHSTPEAPWVAVELDPHSLLSPVAVVRTLVQAASTESGRLREQASGPSGIKRLEALRDLGRTLFRELSDRGGGAGGLSGGGRRERADDITASWVFQDVAALLERFRIVVCVDEAQNMPVAESTKGVMDCLHRDPQGIPLVAAFFGLSDTQEVLRQCGLSRFAGGRVVNLEPLAQEAAAEVFRAVFDTYEFKGTPEERDTWVIRLAELSQGWPQHINRVAVAAARVIQDHGGQIERPWLEQALAQGRERKEEYYAERLAAGSRPPWVYRQMALAAQQKGGVLPYDDLRQFLAEESLDEFLINALHAGLLTQLKHLPYHYRIPIPSFGDYLRTLPVEPPSD